jgi:hypothetical protein
MFSIEEMLKENHADIASNEDLPKRWYNYLKPIAIVLLAVFILGWLSYVILYS